MEVVSLRRLVLALAGLIACCSAVFSSAPRAALRQHAAAAVRPRAAIGRAALAYLSGEISRYQHETWRWQRLMGLHLTQSSGRTLAAMSVANLETSVRLWRTRAVHVRTLAQRPPHRRAWLCIHRYEGSWSDRGAPYYGGLQMDLTFQRHYGAWLLARKGTADHWTPLEQMWIAENALRTRGFFPWPNTARFCGLL